jgi:1,4-dihydroxy-2-naphthoate octaprenyltransferase
MPSALQNWGEILRTQRLSPGRVMDTVSRWLLITRASVIPMTVISGAIGGVLAAGNPNAHWGNFAMALFGLVMAHAANNMINDYLDVESGIDEAEYQRLQFAPHPVLSGLISKTGMVFAIAVANLLVLGVLLYLTEARGWPVAAFALLGLFVSIGQVAPIQLKLRGMGECSAALIWGPLMIGGIYFATTGSLEPWVVVASLPYAALVTTVLIGRHIDNLQADLRKGFQTLPVILGADRSLFLNQQLTVLFFVFAVVLVMVGKIGVWTLLVFATAPLLWKVLKIYARPRPESAPPGYAFWPLWYAAWAFSLTRLAGGLFVLGLILDIFYPVRLG